eukprot:CAMPEP_0172764290 /NCGR_PEP_ID=MMETSP1074-20121228/176987_1 /TAXON_ID=2916 /ORGANISM="Ceratium fusus, Strain PA161109" /LENGTH=49 /DNA_ID= /DNA_START= /DNA_END= /DNA_ORIENTATION=
MFRCMDISNDGSVEYHEMMERIREGLNVPQDLKAYVTEERVADLFDAFD